MGVVDVYMLKVVREIYAMATGRDLERCAVADKAWPLIPLRTFYVGISTVHPEDTFWRERRWAISYE